MKTTRVPAGRSHARQSEDGCPDGSALSDSAVRFPHKVRPAISTSCAGSRQIKIACVALHSYALGSHCISYQTHIPYRKPQRGRQPHYPITPPYSCSTTLDAHPRVTVIHNLAGRRKACNPCATPPLLSGTEREHHPDDNIRL